MDKELLQEKIEAYLNNTLSSEERIAFEKQLVEDEALAKEVFLVKDTNEAIQDMAIEEEYLPHIEALNKKYFKKKPVETVSTKKRESIIIALVLIAGFIFGFFAWQYFSTPDSTEAEEELIFAVYYEPYVADNLTRGTDATTTYDEAIKLYNENDYASVILILETQTLDSTNKIPAQVLLANCYLSSEPKQLQAAIDLLKPLSTDNAHSFTEVTQWYLALAYIDNDELNLAKPILQILADKKVGKYPKMATEILEKMK